MTAAPRTLSAGGRSRCSPCARAGSCGRPPGRSRPAQNMPAAGTPPPSADCSVRDVAIGLAEEHPAAAVAREEQRAHGARVERLRREQQFQVLDRGRGVADVQADASRARRPGRRRPARRARGRRRAGCGSGSRRARSRRRAAGRPTYRPCFSRSRSASGSVAQHLLDALERRLPVERHDQVAPRRAVTSSGGPIGAQPCDTTTSARSAPCSAIAKPPSGDDPVVQEQRVRARPRARRSRARRPRALPGAKRLNEREHALDVERERVAQRAAPARRRARPGATQVERGLVLDRARPTPRASAGTAARRRRAAAPRRPRARGPAPARARRSRRRARVTPASVAGRERRAQRAGDRPAAGACAAERNAMHEVHRAVAERGAARRPPPAWRPPRRRRSSECALAQRMRAASVDHVRPRAGSRARSPCAGSRWCPRRSP